MGQIKRFKMKIAIISDSHDNIPNIQKALKWINSQGIKTIIHCGDLCAPSTLSHIFLPSFKGEIHIVNGNVGDPEELEEQSKQFKNVHFYNWHYSTSARKMTKKLGTILGCGQVELDGKMIAFTHSPNNARELAQTGKYDYVFYGHTHKPWEEKIVTSNQLQVTRLINPGTLAGMFYKATFAVLDTQTGKLELKILERI